ncbi:MAG: NAD-dependent epimerase/dehydratase family protein [Halobacteriaceae archaeon]
MGNRALVIGGTRFVGRHTVEELLSGGYSVTMFNRGQHENPFERDERVDHVEGDRTNESALETARDHVNPSIVIDCVAYYPRDVRAAIEIFEDVDGYVYISSGDAYGAEHIPKREGSTPLRDCTPEQATDESQDTYGNRKAEGDRAVKAAANEGINAMSVRPCIVYGPHDYTERLDYWIDRVLTHDQIIIPGDGTNVWHRAYVKDVARALRIVAESGDPGEAYNVGDRRLVTLEEMVHLIAEVAETAISTVTASNRELSTGDLTTDDFVLYRDYPHILDTSKLASLGWQSTPIATSMEETVAESRASDRDGEEYDPGRDAERRILEVLGTIQK